MGTTVFDAILFLPNVTSVTKRPCVRDHPWVQDQNHPSNWIPSINLRPIRSSNHAIDGKSKCKVCRVFGGLPTSDGGNPSCKIDGYLWSVILNGKSIILPLDKLETYKICVTESIFKAVELQTKERHKMER